MQQSQSIIEINYADSQYPKLLRETDAPPAKLYLRGQLVEMPLVAIVGTRRMSDYGKQVTYRLASELAAAGMGIVSGLAIGVDAVAHEGALASGGYTIAVLGCGVDEIYPPRNRGLAAKILAGGGAIISEQELGSRPFKQNFPARNRIIAGISLGVVVVEAAEKSGALLTAGRASDYNREVMAVPGNITNLASVGPNNLIRRGAQAVVTAEDVIHALGLTSTMRFAPKAAPANKTEAIILELIDQGMTSSSQLIAETQLEAAAFARAISFMEIKGVVRSLGSGVWIRR